MPAAAPGARGRALGFFNAAFAAGDGGSVFGVVDKVIETGQDPRRFTEDLLRRLRDLVDLLDTANLADNAFLFIGQGMVDQALALRPEERRPLFEEVAGVRRHAAHGVDHRHLAHVGVLVARQERGERIAALLETVRRLTWWQFLLVCLPYSVSMAFSIATYAGSRCRTSASNCGASTSPM